MAGRAKAKRYPLVELVSAAIGLAIAGGMFGFLALEAVRQRDGMPPLLSAVPVGVHAQRHGYVVEIEVRNGAGQTAASVQVEGQLKQGDAAVETSSATVAHVPGDSARQAGLVFSRDPRKYRMELRVTGYERP